MADNKLVSMVDYVHQTVEKEKSHSWKLQYIWDYADFLKQPIDLRQFVPCKLVDGVWVVLEKPNFRDTLNSDLHFLATEEYQEAKERVLFEGFEFLKQLDNLDGHSYYRFKLEGCIKNIVFNKTIEDLISYDLTLTQHTAEKLNL